MKIKLALDDWTLGDISVLEEAAGSSLARIGLELSSGDVSAKLAIALVYASKHREDPAFTLDQARSLRLSEIELEPVEPAPLAQPSDES